MAFRRPSKPTMRSDACHLVCRLDSTGKNTVSTALDLKEVIAKNKYIPNTWIQIEDQCCRKAFSWWTDGSIILIESS